MTTVTVYNAGGTEVLHTVTLHHAVRMLRRQVARVKEAVEGEMFGPYQRPRAVELVRYVFTHWRYSNTPATVSKAGILRRDGYRCAYCATGVGNTVDHIHPRARGGKTTWLNCVAACTTCNGTKGHRPLAATGMTLRFAPYAPTRGELRALADR